MIGSHRHGRLRSSATPIGAWTFVTLALASWIVAVGGPGGGSGRAAALVLGVVGAVIAGHLLGRLHPLALPAAVSVSPVVAVVVWGLPPAGPLPYPNASAALLFVASAGALTVHALGRSPSIRFNSLILYSAYAVAAWALGSHTAAILIVTLLPLARVTPARRLGRSWAPLTAILVVAALAATITLALGHEQNTTPRSLDGALDASVSERRIELWSDAIALVRRAPRTGVGWGEFADHSPTARRYPDVAGSAHNEYLQLAAETGLPGGLLALTAVLLALARLRSVADRPAGAVAIAVVAGLGIHASMDYVLRFSAVPLIGAALVGGAVAPRSAMTHRTSVGPAVLSRSRAVASVATWSLLAVLVIPLGPLNPPHLVPNGAMVDPSGVLTFASPGVVHSAEAPRGLYERIASTGAMTIEVWAQAAKRDQVGPARLFSSSGGADTRNVTIGQSGPDLIIRLRTSPGDVNARDSELRVPGVLGDLRLHHLAVVVDQDIVRVHVDGEERSRRRVPGLDLTSWDHDHPLLLGNELGSPRPWLGSLETVAVHDHPLTPRTIHARYGEGVDHPETRTAGAVAAYARFDVVTGRVPDRSDAGLGGRLTVPVALAVPPGEFVDVALALDQHRPLFDASSVAAAWSGQDLRVLRMLGHLALFAAWGRVVARRHRSRLETVSSVAVVCLGAGALALAIEWSQYLAARSPSVVDVLTATVGAAVGVWAARSRAADADPESRHRP